MSRTAPEGMVVVTLSAAALKGRALELAQVVADIDEQKAEYTETGAIFRAVIKELEARRARYAEDVVTGTELRDSQEVLALVDGPVQSRRKSVEASEP